MALVQNIEPSHNNSSNTIIVIFASNSNSRNHSNTNKSPKASKSRYPAWKGQGHGPVRISVVERGGEHGHDLVVSNEV